MRTRTLATAFLAGGLLGSPSLGVTVAETIGGGNWTLPNLWGYPIDSDCYPDNGSATYGDGHWWVTLNACCYPTTLNVPVTLDRLFLGRPLQGTGADLIINELLTMEPGGLNTGGQVHVVPGALLNVINATVGNTTVLLNEGTARMTDSLRINEPAEVWNASEWILSNGDFWAPGAGGGRFVNDGLFRKIGPGVSSTTLVFDALAGSDVKIEEGTFIMQDGVNLAGDVEVWAGATLDIRTVVNFDPAANVHGPGAVSIGVHPAVIDVPCTWNVTGPSLFDGGTVNFSAPGTVKDASLCWGTISGDLVVNGYFEWTQGTMIGPGTTWLNGGGTIGANATCGIVGVKSLDGRLLQLAAGQNVLVTHGIAGHNGAVLANPAGGILQLFSNTDISTWHSTGATIENAGALEKIGPGSTSVSWSTVNTGVVDVLEGSLAFPVSYVQSAGETRLHDTNLDATYGVPIDIRSGGLTGSGTIGGGVPTDLLCDGTIAPGASAGLIDVRGLVTLGTNAVLDMEIGGTTPASDHDQLTAGNAVALAGALQVTLINGFESAVQNGDVFEIVVVPAHLEVLGTFANTASGDTLMTADGAGRFTVWYGTGSPFGANKVVLTNFRCFGDFDGNGEVGFADLALLLGNWGPCPAAPAPCPWDRDRDGTVGFTDLSALLGTWGACP